jgi:hypothetical protein
LEGIPLRVFKNKRFKKFTRKQNISDEQLLEVVRRVEVGQIDADLGGGVIKQRVERQGQGKRGGYRAILLYRSQERAFFVYGFAKNEQENISVEELEVIREMAALYLTMAEKNLKTMIDNADLWEVPNHVKEV